ncbi:CRP-like cAMP-binding protein [Mucilaginibacter sp. SG538B]|uniref:Crp/Fnr family transcriptional regulator n=1 Tax=Mucilaginibacter sp. SG538B TaxID=2587021 RepID=UPI00159D71EC|nr:Crp/Fnr family transcriptional regulator [Mucilaginibacter sp. SG538B]NVM66735.1 CRP-like cAMP-binding protein [Mucilaginibacter sp. SG538B]
MHTSNNITDKGASVQPVFKMHALNNVRGKLVLQKTEKGAHEMLLSYIQRFSSKSLSEWEKDQIRKACKIKLLRRRQYLLQQGDICKCVGFIIQGATRMYSINERGQEAIISFCVEEDWVADQESLALQLPSLYHIEAVEDTVMLLIPLSHLQLLSAIVPTVEQMVSINYRQQYIATQKRIHAAISMTAEEQYLYMLTCNPEYMQRFSQNMIAAYLGIKPETLSRVRTKMDH